MLSTHKRIKNTGNKKYPGSGGCPPDVCQNCGLIKSINDAIKLVYKLDDQDDLLFELRQLRVRVGRYLLPHGVDAANTVQDLLLASEHCQQVEFTGELRRCLETVSQVELLVSCTNPDALPPLFADAPQVSETKRAGEHALDLTVSTRTRVRVHMSNPDRWAVDLVQTTGSPAHVEKLKRRAAARGLNWTDKGIFRDGVPFRCESESILYAALDLAWIPPELREDIDEIDLAANHALPRLIRNEDLKGMLHVHTTDSDGQCAVEVLVEAAMEQNLEYIGISDHSRSAYYARGLDIAAIRRQHEHIDKLNRQYQPFRIFKGIESDILPNGSLDYPREILNEFDFVIASVHAYLSMSRNEMKTRIDTVIRNPFTTILGHPTGRILLWRDSYYVDVPHMLQEAAQYGPAVEINTNPARLDLDWRHHRLATHLGVPLIISPDAHDLPGLNDTACGVAVARKGGLRPDDVLNCRGAEEMASYLQESKAKRLAQ